MLRNLQPFFKIFVGVILFLVATDMRAQFFQRSFALVIGVDRYPSESWGDLGYAKKDAKGVAAFLISQGFEVIPLYDHEAKKQRIISEMQNLGRILTNNDRVLVFFSGHGYTEEIGGQDWGYIVPFDGGGDSASYISMEELQTLAKKMGKARHQLFIMDSCFGGHLVTKGGHGVSLNHPNYLREITNRPARQIITAGGKGQRVVDNGPMGYSVFTGYLLEALQIGNADLDGDGYITFQELASYLTPRASNSYQTPASGYLPGHGAGEFIFRSPKGGTPITPIEPIAPKFRDQEARASIVTDDQTGLMWTREDNGENINGHNAKRYCESLTLGGYADWRLPPIEELEKLYDPREKNIRHPFRLTGLYGWVWSSTKVASDSAMFFDFSSGGRYRYPLASPGSKRALCVRRSGK